jgi:hypothetical protein
LATVFQNILMNAEKRGITDQKSKESIDWFRKNVRKTSRIQPPRIIREEKANLVNSWTNTGPGRLYMVYYDPKHKATLPFYDSFPLIIPIERYKDGILGINLHYLPPILRARLLDSLYDTVTNDKFDETTQMKVSYGILKNASKFSLFKPCIKRYLGKHFRSRFIKIPPAQWTPAVFLPVEQFQKASQKTVWADSRKKVK